MRIKNYILLAMLVMLICCVTAVSAADIENTDNISEDITADEITDVIEEVEIDEVDNDPVENENLRTTTGTINGNSYTQYFNDTGYLYDNDVWQLTFNGYFDEVDSTFGNFKINRQITLDVSNATFNNIGFDLISDNLNLNGATFTCDANTLNTATINVYGNNVIVNNTNINVVAPENTSYIAIDVENASNVRLLNNIINYTCGYTNPTYYNYVIKAKNSSNINIISNNILATVPLKTVNWIYWGSIDADYVAGVAIEKCNTTQFLYNNLTVIGNKRAGNYPTLDALIIADSYWAHIEHNIINENDIITTTGNYSYIYGIDVYSCTGIIINNNTVTMNGNNSGGQDIISGNGTGAAYCIQLSGNHSLVVVSNNILTTQNNGPNLGIYSQNYHAASYLNITGNTIKVSGKAGSDSWSLVSGIEVQDTSANIYGNNITVNNTAGYNETYYAFGISYSQWTNHTHYYDIKNNNVTVYNAYYAVYLLNDTEVSGSIDDNTLIAIINSTTHNDGNDAVFAPIETIGIND